MDVVLALFLSLAPIPNVADPGIPGEIPSSLREIRRHLDFAEECVYYNPDLEDRFDKLDSRFFSAAFDAFGTWGGDPEFPYTEFYWIHPARCRRQDESRALRELEQSLDSFSRLYRALTLQMDQPGLWVGPLKVCRDHVRGTAFKSNERGGPALTVELTKEAGSYWAAITGRSVNGELYIRVDGKIVSKLLIYERIESNRFWITGVDQTILTRAATLATSPC